MYEETDVWCDVICCELAAYAPHFSTLVQSIFYQCCMLQGIFACFNVLSSRQQSMSSSVAKKDMLEKPSGIARLEANVEIMRSDPDFVFTKDEALDWLGQAIVLFESLSTTSQSADEILHHAVDVGQAAKLVEAFDGCQRSRCMLAEPFVKKRLRWSNKSKTCLSFNNLLAELWL